MKKLLLIVLVLGALGAGAAWYYKKDNDAAATFRTVELKRGELLATIGATGTLQPEEVIDVGAQVAGQIMEFGKDTAGNPVDFNSMVDEGGMLAKIDPSTYEADVALATAQLGQANASLQRANADLVQLQSKLQQAQRDWERAQKLGPSDALAQAQYDAYLAAYEQAKANVAVGDAAIVQAKAAIDASKSTLNKANRNYGFTVIKSPVRGVIIARRVNIG